MRQWTKAENELAHRVRAACLDEWRTIRVLCPRGHYVSHLTIGVPVVEDRDRAPLWLWPHRSNQEPSGDMTSDRIVIDWHHGSQSTSVSIRCGHKRCSFHGRRDMFGLAVEAGAAALAGQDTLTLMS